MTLLVSPAGRAGEFAGPPPAKVLTFASKPDAARPQVAGAARLDLTFNDIAGAREGLVAPSAAHVRAILDFAADWDRSAPMLLCCYAGISRSTAAAYIVACARTPAGRETALAAELRALSPSATPNPLMVALADDALGREGRMRAAVAALGRGAEAFEGTPFRWRLS